MMDGYEIEEKVTKYIKEFEKQYEYAEAVVKNIENDPRVVVKYKESRPIVNIKHMLETSVELYGDNTVFWEKEKKVENINQ